jgi:hypothetical protein
MPWELKPYLVRRYKTRYVLGYLLDRAIVSREQANEGDAILQSQELLYRLSYVLVAEISEWVFVQGADILAPARENNRLDGLFEDLLLEEECASELFDMFAFPNRGPDTANTVFIHIHGSQHDRKDPERDAHDLDT